MTCPNNPDVKRKNICICNLPCLKCRCKEIQEKDMKIMDKVNSQGLIVEDFNTWKQKYDEARRIKFQRNVEIKQAKRIIESVLKDIQTN
jgi:hypothetical protein